MLFGRRWSWIAVAAGLAIVASASGQNNTVTLTAQRDTWLNYNSPGTKYGDNNNLKVEYDDEEDTEPPKTAALWFDLTGVPRNVPILRAELRVWCYDDGQSLSLEDNYVEITAGLLTAGWEELQATWDYRNKAQSVWWTPPPPGLREDRGGLSDFEEDSEASIGPGPDADFHEDEYAIWDVAWTVDQWLNQGVANNGFLLVATDADIHDNDATLQFYAREAGQHPPQLFIEWDDDPPTPNPMSFSTPPHAIGTSAIAMTATLAADPWNQSLPVWYEFDLVSGGIGGAGSRQIGRDYTNSGLEPNTQYTYRVRAVDNVGNATGWSASANAYTWANTPLPPMLYDPTQSTMQIAVESMPPYINPAWTQHAIRCQATNPSDPNWLGKYLSASGDPVTAPVWRTNNEWSFMTIRGLKSDTAYTFAVKARNGDSVETPFGPAATLRTLPATTATGDLNCDGAVNFRDINPFVLALTSSESYAQTHAACNIMNADINGDGAVDFKDINSFVTLLTSGGTGGT